MKNDEVPKSLTDLLLPKWKGKIAMDHTKPEWFAWKLKRTLHLNVQDGSIMDDPEAMGMRKREYEKGWELTI